MGSRSFNWTLVVLFASAFPVFAGPEDPSREIKAAQSVLGAAPADRYRLLQQVAADELHDIWVVWERLAVSGKPELRDLYRALVADKALDQYAVARKSDDSDRATWREWNRGRKVRLSNFTEDARKLFLELKTGRNVTGVLRHLELARCLRDQNRPQDAVDHWVAGARLARELGWAEAYRYGLHVFAFDIAKPNSATGARQDLLSLASNLEEGEAVVRLVPAGAHLLAIVLERGTVRAGWIGRIDEFSVQVARLVQLGAAGAARSRQLAVMFEPAIHLGPNVQRVHVVADAQLAMVPFEAIFPRTAVTRSAYAHFAPAESIRADSMTGALLSDATKSGWSHSERFRGLFDKVREAPPGEVRKFDAAAEKGRTWRAVVLSLPVERRTGRKPSDSAKDPDDMYWLSRELAGRFSSKSHRTIEYVIAHVLVLPSGPTVLPSDRQRLPRAGVVDYLTRSSQTVLRLAYQIPEKSKAAFLSVFLKELNGTVSGKPVDAAVAALRARQACVRQGGSLAEHAWAWQLWTE